MNVSSLKCSMVHTKMTNATCYSENRISQNRMMVINANKLLSFLQFVELRPNTVTVNIKRLSDRVAI